MMFPDYGKKRRYARLNPSYVASCAKTRQGSMNEEERRHAASAHGRSGGFVFASKELFGIGDILRLELRIPGWAKFLASQPRMAKPQEDDKLEVLGKVTLVEMTLEDDYDIGVCFVNLDSGRRELLLRHLIAGMHAALGPAQASLAKRGRKPL
ncbi:MAG: hypothetical protein WC421_06775 [Elusimicrobiales bacterium]